MPDTFSKRHGFSNNANTEITVREDAPEGLPLGYSCYRTESGNDTTPDTGDRV